MYPVLPSSELVPSHLVFTGEPQSPGTGYLLLWLSKNISPAAESQVPWNRLLKMTPVPPRRRIPAH
jgi:hypothetical protein